MASSKKVALEGGKEICPTVRKAINRETVVFI